MRQFELISKFKPTGDQPQAIEKLVMSIKAGLKHQVLLGVTGSGKTFTMANVIEQIQKPTLVISHNKTLAAQLFQEFREFFPKNQVEYFVSYYDYYQPEAYVPQRDLYIEKEVDINEEIDKLRLSTTTSLVTHQDTIVVASVSCIYNLGSPIEYAQRIVEMREGMKLDSLDLIKRLHQLYYEREEYEFRRGSYRVRGDILDIYPAYEDFAIRLEFLGKRLLKIKKIEPISGDIIEELKLFVIYPAKHYLTADERKMKALREIERDLEKRLRELKKEGKNLEAYRLEQRTNYDLELIREIGYCHGIENYSRYFDGRAPGEPPFTLLDFFQLPPGKHPTFSKDADNGFITIIDESHMTMPQLRGMYNGDRARKEILIDYGFRLPSALDNRPLKFNEFLNKVPRLIYVSATPDSWEISKSRGVVEQLIRPTGILDPKIEIRSTAGQIKDLIKKIEKRVTNGERVLVTTLTKRMAEDLSSFLEEKKIKCHYLHSEVATLERTDILEDLRRGKYDVVVGINLLREGLDLPEVSLVAILDTDKEGFLRSETSLIQTMGRAARHVQGKVIMYADEITGSMKRAIAEVGRRRKVQEAYNKSHNIKPRSIKKDIRAGLIEKAADFEEEIRGHELTDEDILQMLPHEKQKFIKKLTQEMKLAAKDLRFEEATRFRDTIKRLKK